MTLLFAVSRDGVVGFRVLDHNCKKNDFVAFVESLHLPPHATVVMDNIAFHHSRESVAAVESQGAKCLFTLPYSPRSNAIENVFSALKARYRARCPTHSTTGFDYHACLESLIGEWWSSSRSFVDVFDHVQKIVDETRRRGGVDFCGYD